MTVLNRTKNACSTRVFCHQLHQRTVLNSGVPQLKKLNKDDSETIAQRIRPLVGGQNVSLAEAVRSQHGTDPFETNSLPLQFYPRCSKNSHMESYVGSLYPHKLFPETFQSLFRFFLLPFQSLYRAIPEPFQSHSRVISGPLLCNSRAIPLQF